jgi:glycosyltransferase involved in cell wall biosynthesis
MRLGLYGGMANNCYVFAHAFVRAGMEVCFIRDRSDTYAMSQPVWEDVGFTLPYDEVTNSASIAWQWWRKKETELGWTPPDWLLDPFEAGSGPLQPKFENFRFWMRPYASRYLDAAVHRRAVLKAMMDCDVLLVCGVEGEVLAALSGRPYVIWPHGGDIRTAAGLAPKQPLLKPRLHQWLFTELLKDAFALAASVATHCPDAVGGHIGDARRAIGNRSLGHLPIPMSQTTRLPRVARKNKLNELAEQIGLDIDGERAIGLVPSRLDFYWKGQDRVLRAVAQLPPAARPFTIFSGWGADMAAATAFVRAYGLRDDVAFLPFAMSKPLLHEFFIAADYAIDQFEFGTYGSAMAEAMSTGCPVIMWINAGLFKAEGWEPPPVINARTDADLASAFRKITSGEFDLDAASLECQRWSRRVHEPMAVIDLFVQQANRLFR